jgi:Na+/H+ antiporter NhaD/arsenite permease-like protein
LVLPTAINLLAAFFILKLFYRESFHGEALVHVRQELRDPRLARLACLSLILIILLVLLKITLVFALPQVNFRLTWIALIAAAPILLFSPRRFSILVTWTGARWYSSRPCSCSWKVSGIRDFSSRCWRDGIRTLLRWA